MFLHWKNVKLTWTWIIWRCGFDPHAINENLNEPLDSTRIKSYKSIQIKFQLNAQIYTFVKSQWGFSASPTKTLSCIVRQKTLISWTNFGIHISDTSWNQNWFEVLWEIVSNYEIHYNVNIRHLVYKSLLSVIILFKIMGAGGFTAAFSVQSDIFLPPNISN